MLWPSLLLLLTVQKLAGGRTVLKPRSAESSPDAAEQQASVETSDASSQSPESWSSVFANGREGSNKREIIPSGDNPTAKGVRRYEEGVAGSDNETSATAPVLGLGPNAQDGVFDVDAEDGMLSGASHKLVRRRANPPLRRTGSWSYDRWSQSDRLTNGNNERHNRRPHHRADPAFRQQLPANQELARKRDEARAIEDVLRRISSFGHSGSGSPGSSDPEVTNAVHFHGKVKPGLEKVLEGKADIARETEREAQKRQLDPDARKQQEEEEHRQEDLKAQQHRKAEARRIWGPVAERYQREWEFTQGDHPDAWRRAAWNRAEFEEPNDYDRKKRIPRDRGKGNLRPADSMPRFHRNMKFYLEDDKDTGETHLRWEKVLDFEPSQTKPSQRRMFHNVDRTQDKIERDRVLRSPLQTRGFEEVYADEMMRRLILDPYRSKFHVGFDEEKNRLRAEEERSKPRPTDPKKLREHMAFRRYGRLGLSHYEDLDLLEKEDEARQKAASGKEHATSAEPAERRHHEAEEQSHFRPDQSPQTPLHRVDNLLPEHLRKEDHDVLQGREHQRTTSLGSKEERSSSHSSKDDHPPRHGSVSHGTARRREKGEMPFINDPTLNKEHSPLGQTIDKTALDQARREFPLGGSSDHLGQHLRRQDQANEERQAHHQSEMAKVDEQFESLREPHHTHDDHDRHQWDQYDHFESGHDHGYDHELQHEESEHHGSQHGESQHHGSQHGESQHHSSQLEEDKQTGSEHSHEYRSRYTSSSSGEPPPMSSEDQRTLERLRERAEDYNREVAAQKEQARLRQTQDTMSRQQAEHQTVAEEHAQSTNRHGEALESHRKSSGDLHIDFPESKDKLRQDQKENQHSPLEELHIDFPERQDNRRHDQKRTDKGASQELRQSNPGSEIKEAREEHRHQGQPQDSARQGSQYGASKHAEQQEQHHHRQSNQNPSQEIHEAQLPGRERWDHHHQTDSGEEAPNYPSAKDHLAWPTEDRKGHTYERGTAFEDIGSDVFHGDSGSMKHEDTSSDMILNTRERQHAGANIDPGNQRAGDRGAHKRRAVDPVDQPTPDLAHQFAQSLPPVRTRPGDKRRQQSSSKLKAARQQSQPQPKQRDDRDGLQPDGPDFKGKLKTYNPFTKSWYDMQRRRTGKDPSQPYKRKTGINPVVGVGDRTPQPGNGARDSPRGQGMRSLFNRWRKTPPPTVPKQQYDELHRSHENLKANTVSKKKYASLRQAHANLWQAHTHLQHTHQAVKLNAVPLQNFERLEQAHEDLQIENERLHSQLYQIIKAMRRARAAAPKQSNSPDGSPSHSMGAEAGAEAGARPSGGQDAGGRVDSRQAGANQGQPKGDGRADANASEFAPFDLENHPDSQENRLNKARWDRNQARAESDSTKEQHSRDNRRSRNAMAIGGPAMFAGGGAVSAGTVLGLDHAGNLPGDQRKQGTGGAGSSGSSGSTNTKTQSTQPVSKVQTPGPPTPPNSDAPGAPLSRGMPGLQPPPQGSSQPPPPGRAADSPPVAPLTPPSSSRSGSSPNSPPYQYGKPPNSNPPPQNNPPPLTQNNPLPAPRISLPPSNAPAPNQNAYQPQSQGQRASRPPTQGAVMPQNMQNRPQ